MRKPLGGLRPPQFIPCITRSKVIEQFVIRLSDNVDGKSSIAAKDCKLLTPVVKYTSYAFESLQFVDLREITKD